MEFLITLSSIKCEGNYFTVVCDICIFFVEGERSRLAVVVSAPHDLKVFFAASYQLSSIITPADALCSHIQQHS